MVRHVGEASRATAWRVVVSFGAVSLFADMVYEGARSIYGPVLAALGASAVVVGIVTGAGEAMALVLRLVTGPAADRGARHWAFTIGGYALTAVCVPLLAVTPLVGGLGLTLAIVLILAERGGKAVRSPSKTALLAVAAAQVGRGKGFGIHKMLDQIGAFAGPLLVAALIAGFGSLWAAPGWLVLPGTVAVGILLVIRRRVPDLEVAAPATHAERWWADTIGAGFPSDFYRYAVAASLTTGGLVTFGVISFHMATTLDVPADRIALVYAGAMLVEAAAAMVIGWLYDRRGAVVLCTVPLLVALVPALTLGSSLTWVLVGMVVWGVALGIQDSSIKAVVADLVEPSRLATAYGVFAAIQGAMALVGGGVAGYFLDRSVPTLVVIVAVSQLVALVLFVRVVRRGSVDEDRHPAALEVPVQAHATEGHDDQSDAADDDADEQGQEERADC